MEQAPDRPQRSRPPGSVHRSWPAAPGQLVRIRAWIRESLAPLDLTEDLCQALVLAVNEAATNAVEHAYRPASTGDTVDVTLWTERRFLCVEVVDHGRWRPPTNQPGSRGRGLTLMRRLADLVLIDHDARGTRVLLMHPIRGRAQAGPAGSRAHLRLLPEEAPHGERAGDTTRTAVPPDPPLP